MQLLVQTLEVIVSLFHKQMGDFVQSDARNPAALPDEEAKSSGDDSIKCIVSGFVLPEFAR